MNNCRMRILSPFVLLSLLLALAGTPGPALAGENTCNWSPGPDDFFWGNGDNWACSGGKGPPKDENDVVISAGRFNAPEVTGNDAVAKTVSLDGYLLIDGGASLAVSDGWSNSGEAYLDSQGTIIGNGEVKPTGTFHFLSSPTIDGDLTIDSLATASIDVVYAQRLVINGGMLIGEGENKDAQFHMRGPAFTNNGSVSVNAFYFQRGGDHIQEVTGSGGWYSGIDYLYVDENTRLTPRSDMTFGPSHFLIRDGSLLDVGTYSITFASPVEVSAMGPIIGAQDGSVHTQNTPVSISIPNESAFDPPLVVESGITRVTGVFSGPITVNQDATLRVMAPPAGGQLTATNNVTVNGTMDGEDNEVSFVMQGAQLAVKGQVTVPSVYLQGVLQQNISGDGSIDIHNLTVDTPPGVKLGTPLNLDDWLALNANLYGHDKGVVTLAESAVINGSNADTDIFGTIKRSGPLMKDKTYSFGNRYLTVVFPQAGSGLPTEVRMDLGQKRWDKLSGSIQRRFTLTTTGGSGWSVNLTLDYRDAEVPSSTDYLQTWTRASGSQPWTRVAYTEAYLNQHWIEIDGLTHSADWGLVLHAVFCPIVRK